MRARPIQSRLTIWYSLVLAGGLILLAVAVWVSMRVLLLRDVRQLLMHQAISSRTFVDNELSQPNVHLGEELEEFSGALPAGGYLRIFDDTGRLVFNSKQDFAWPSSDGRVDWLGQPYLVFLSKQDVKGKIWLFGVTASLKETEAVLRRLLMLLVMLVPVVMSVAALGGWWLSRKALAPVDAMTAAAQRIGAANLAERLPVTNTGDELQRLAETWNSMLARLEESLKRLSRFTADASHELRTPLAIIRTTAELALRRPRAAEVYRDALEQVSAESERMTRLLEDLLLLARVDAEAVEMPESAFDLTPLVDSLCHQMGPLAEARQLAVRFQRPNGGAVIIGNEAAIRRLVTSLLDNAVKYSREGEGVGVVLRTERDEISLEVIDSGPGIEESELPRIFERFYRGADARASTQEGWGLGLSLAAKLAERNHAHIQVRSRPGEGSTFRVSFRLAA